MSRVRKSKSHAESDAKAQVSDPIGFEERKEEFVQRMVTEGLAKLEDKLKTRHGKKVFRDEVKFQKNLHKEATALKCKMVRQHRHELRLVETAIVAKGSIDWRSFVSAARALRKKVGGRGIQVMWWAMNTAERSEVQVTDLRKWLKGKSRLNNELAIRLRAKLAMFSDLIQQIRDKARLVYRDGDPRFKTYCLEKLMEDYSNMADKSAESLAPTPPKITGVAKTDSETKREEKRNDGLVSVKVQVTGKRLDHTYHHTFNLRSPKPWFLQQSRGLCSVGQPLTVQIGARSFLAYVPECPENGSFKIEIPQWMCAYLADQEANDFLASTRAARHSVHGPKLNLKDECEAGGGFLKKNGFSDSMLDVILNRPTTSPDASPADSKSGRGNEVKIAEGNLMKQGAKFGLWHTRYFRLHVHFLAYWRTKSAYLRGTKSARNTPGHQVASPSDEWQPSNLAQQLDSASSGSGSRHSSITELQASHDAVSPPEACFDLHLLQSAIVERQDIILKFTAVDNGSLERRLRAPSHASALAWQEAIYQHYTWYCTNRETELLAFMNTAQQKSRQSRRPDNEQHGLDRETFDGLTRPRSNSNDVLQAIVRSRREVHRKHDLAARVKDTPRSHNRRMKSSMTTRATAEEWRYKRQEKENAIVAARAMEALARTQIRSPNKSGETSEDDADEQSAPYTPPAMIRKKKLDMLPLDTALHSTMKNGKGRNKHLSHPLPSTPPPAFSPAARSRIIHSAPSAYGTGYSPRGSADSPHGQYVMSPHKRVLAGKRGAGWARQRYPELQQAPPPPSLDSDSDDEQGSDASESANQEKWGQPPPFSADLLDSPRPPHKGRVPMSPLQQRGPAKLTRFASADKLQVPKKKTTTTTKKMTCEDRHNENVVVVPPPPSVPHPKHLREAQSTACSKDRVSAIKQPICLVDDDAVSPANRGKWSANRHSVRVIF